MISKDSINLFRQITVVIAVIATITVNILANALPINGVTTGELAAQFDVLFSPAAYAFSIWGLIYAGLGVYAVYQAQPRLRNSPRMRSLDPPFLLSCVANMAWLLLWHHQFYVSTFVVILVLLGSLVTIYARLEPERGTATAGRRWAVHHVFSAYLSWVTVASLANLGVALEYVGWTGWGISELTWFAVGVVLVLGVAAMVAWRRADVVYLLVLVWAFIGIGVERAADPRVSTLAWTATAVLAMLAALSAIRRTPDESMVLTGR